jgi:hypothetical protein
VSQESGRSFPSRNSGRAARAVLPMLFSALIVCAAPRCAGASPQDSQEPALGPSAGPPFELFLRLAAELPLEEVNPIGPQIPPALFALPQEAARRPSPLLPLYVQYAGLQVLDVHSTRLAVDAGHSEGNPLMAPLVSKPAALVAVKAGAAFSTIYLTEKLWKKNRVAAVAFMVGVNSAYAIVAARNYRLAAK